MLAPPLVDRRCSGQGESDQRSPRWRAPLCARREESVVDEVVEVAPVVPPPAPAQEHEAEEGEVYEEFEVPFRRSLHSSRR